MHAHRQPDVPQTTLSRRTAAIHLVEREPCLHDLRARDERTVDGGQGVPRQRPAADAVRGRRAHQSCLLAPVEFSRTTSGDAASHLAAPRRHRVHESLTVQVCTCVTFLGDVSAISRRRLGDVSATSRRRFGDVSATSRRRLGDISAT